VVRSDNRKEVPAIGHSGRYTSDHLYLTTFGFAEGGRGTLTYIQTFLWGLAVIAGRAGSTVAKDDVLYFPLRILVGITPVILSSMAVALYVRHAYRWRWIPAYILIAVTTIACLG
jgi:hypothetical protein